MYTYTHVNYVKLERRDRSFFFLRLHRLSKGVFKLRIFFTVWKQYRVDFDEYWRSFLHKEDFFLMYKRYLLIGPLILITRTKNHDYTDYGTVPQ